MKLGVVVSSLCGASVVGVAAVGSYKYLSSDKDAPVSINVALKGSRLISSLSGDALTKQWVEEFKSAKGDIKREIKDLSEVTEDEDGGKKLEGWCSRQMDLDSEKNVDILVLVRKYCLIRSLSSQFSRTGKHLLVGTGKESEWKATYQKRKTLQTSRADMGLTDNWNGDQETVDLPKVQSRCSDDSSKDFLVTEDLYTKLLKWCTQEGVNEE